MMALYNNGYPATYQQYYPQYQAIAPAVQQTQNQQSGLIWIQGEQAAKSYLVAPNTTVALFDSENMTVYLKSADASGMPSIKILDYTIRDSAKNTANNVPSTIDDKLSMYATKDEINAVSERLSALQKKLDKLMKKEDDE